VEQAHAYPKDRRTTGAFFSGRQDAALYGSQDGRRYAKHIHRRGLLTLLRSCLPTPLEACFALVECGLVFEVKYGWENIFVCDMVSGVTTLVRRTTAQLCAR